MHDILNKALPSAIERLSGFGRDGSIRTKWPRQPGSVGETAIHRWSEGGFEVSQGGSYWSRMNKEGDLKRGLRGWKEVNEGESVRPCHGEDMCAVRNSGHLDTGFW